MHLYELDGICSANAITKESIRKVWPYFADKKMRKKNIAELGDKEKHWIFNKEPVFFQLAASQKW